MAESPTEAEGLVRARAFARSLLPTDLSQLLLLGGFVCLFIAPSLGWWPEELAKLQRLTDSTPSQEYRQVYWRTFRFVSELFLMTLPIRVAGAASLFACFFAPKRLMRLFLYWVYLPVLISLMAVSARLFFAFRSPPSILESPVKRALGSFENAPQIFLRLGPGFHYTLAGVLFVALVAWRSRRLVLPPTASSDSSLKFILHVPPTELFELQTLRFSWILVVTPLLIRIVVMGFTYAYTAMANAISFWPDWALGVFRFFGEGLFSLIFVGIAAWAIGERRYEVLKNSLRAPEPVNLGLAVLLPISAACSFPFFTYMNDRIHWATFGYGNYGPPSLASYFHNPGILSLWAIIPALAEEIAWRGYMQPRFIQLYGVVRGIFFTGIVWGAFHFTFDFGPLMKDQDVFLALGRRLAMTVTLSVVLAWITLRSRSVWPAAIVHGLYNILLSVGTPLPLAPWSTYVVWMLLGLALFRSWPPKIMPVSGPTLGGSIQ